MQIEWVIYTLYAIAGLLLIQPVMAGRPKAIVYTLPFAGTTLVLAGMLVMFKGETLPLQRITLERIDWLTIWAALMCFMLDSALTRGREKRLEVLAEENVPH